MIIERENNEVVFRISGDVDIDDLQDIADFIELREIAKNSKATRKDVDELVKEIKKGHWEETKKKLDL